MKKLKTTNSPSVILKLKNIKPNSKITLFNIAHCIKLKWTLSQGLLAEMGGMSERTINRCLNELEENGYIKRDTKLFNGKGKETSYTIIWDSITKYAKEYEWYEDKSSNTADLSPSNTEDIPTPQQAEEKPTEATKTAIEETIPNEFMEGLTDNTEEVEFDNFSETFNKWLDDGKEEKLMEMATNIVKYEYMGLKVAKTAYELAKTRFQQMLESLDGQDEKDMLCRHFDELLMLKKENYKEFIKVA